MRSIPLLILACSLLLPTQSSANGMLWSRIVGTKDGDQEGRVAADGRGSVYIASRTLRVTGEDESTVEQSRIHLIKQDASGRKVWERAFQGASAIYLSDLSVDGRGDIYLLGHFYGRFEGSRSLGECDALLLKLDSNGRKVWVRTFGTKGIDYGRDLAIGAGGAVYATVSVHGEWEGQVRPGHDDILLLKFGPGGKRDWSRFFGTPGIDEANGIALDGRENVYLAQTSTEAGDGKTLPPGMGSLIRFDSSGTRKWEVRLASDSSTVLEAVAAGTDGMISVLGTRTRPADRSIQSVLNETRISAFLAVFNAGGDNLGTHPLGLGIRSSFLAADARGKPCVFGSASDTLEGADPSAGAHYFLFAVGNDGAAKPTRSRKGTALETIQDVAQDAEGFLYAVGAANGACGDGRGLGGTDLCLVKWTPVPPSFDCAKASTLQERMICGSQALSALDDSIATLYSSLRNSSPNPEGVKAEQMTWMKERRNACTSQEQMSRTLQERLGALRSRAGKP